jgi:hypothetical protein
MSAEPNPSLGTSQPPNIAQEAVAKVGRHPSVVPAASPKARGSLQAAADGGRRDAARIEEIQDRLRTLAAIEALVSPWGRRLPDDETLRRRRGARGSRRRK